MGKHSAPESQLDAVEGKLLTPFVKRLAEQAAVAYLASFVPLLIGMGSFTKAALTGAAVAGLRAAYGVVVKDIGAHDTPSLG